MSVDNIKTRARRPWGVFLLAIAIFIAAIAVGIVPVEASAIYAPRWVLYLISVAFAFAAVLMLVGQNSRASDLLAAIVLLSMALVGGWISILGSSDNLTGGLIFLPNEANIILARFLFGFGAILTLVIFVYAVWQALQRDTEQIRGADIE